MLFVVSATPYEVEPFLKRLTSVGVAHTYIECGIGALTASANGALNRERCRNHRVIFVGTCGIYAPFHEVEVVQVATIHWLPLCQSLGQSYTVSDTPPLTIPSLNRWSLRKIDLICTPNVSLIGMMRGNNYGENLEAYAFLRSLIDDASSIDVLMAITNSVGEQAHQQWLANNRRARDLCSDVIANNFFENRELFAETLPSIPPAKITEATINQKL